MRLLPRDGRFFDLFTHVATLNRDAAIQLREMFAAEGDAQAYRVEAIKRLEREADSVTLEVVTRLDKTFITPLDREDIHALASRLDDVLDRIDGVARRTMIFRAEGTPEGVLRMCDVIVRMTEELLGAVRILEQGKAPIVIEACGRVKQLEEEGDSVYGTWLGRLFDEERDPIALLKWKEIYDILEETLDQAEDVANVLESVAIKHS